MTGRRFDEKKASVIMGVDNPALELDDTIPRNNASPGETVGNGVDGRPRSFCYLTLEALPRVDYYKDNKEAMKRPSIGELRGEVRPPEKTVSIIFYS